MLAFFACPGSANAWKYCTEVFDYMALASVIDGSILCVHGGLSPNLTTLVRSEFDLFVWLTFCVLPRTGPDPAD